MHRYLYAYSNPAVWVDQDGNSATVVGGVGGFFWGFGQMMGGMANDLWEGKTRSTSQYLGVWGQNIVAGAEMGASVDVALLSGGTSTIMGSGALGAAGFDAMTFGGQADAGLGEFAKNQGENAAYGAVLGPVFAKAAPLLGKAVSKIPVPQVVSKGFQWSSQKIAEKAGQIASKLKIAPQITGEAKDVAVQTGRSLLPNVKNANIALGQRGSIPVLPKRVKLKAKVVGETVAPKSTRTWPKSWSGAKQRIWRETAGSELANPSGKYSAGNLARMVEGYAPKVRAKVKNLKTGRVQTKDISVELHHRNLPQRSGTPKAHEPWNIEPANPWSHEAMDVYRNTGYELIKIIKGANSW